ncbi:hypothetical protein [Vallitalea guaymasensis]|uniref:hypothetical protein n=1 Tax=Vallitalea guaymasensis TaxID=1185412 RepID=UPI000DE1B304|nr:hypothetical protein [Vallitalea guaymasensis]
MKNKDMEIILLIDQITRIALLVNGATDHNVFFQYSGHVNQLSVQVHENGWVENKRYSKGFDVDLNSINANGLLIEVKTYLTDLYMAEVQNILMEGAK